MEESGLKSIKYHIAQVNIGKILGPMNSTIMHEFAVNLEPINQLTNWPSGAKGLCGDKKMITIMLQILRLFKMI